MGGVDSYPFHFTRSEGCLVQVCVTLKLLRLLFELGVELRRSDMDELHLKSDGLGLPPLSSWDKLRTLVWWLKLVVC